MKKIAKMLLPILLSVLLICLSVTCVFAQDFTKEERDAIEHSFLSYLENKWGYDLDAMPDFTKEPGFYFTNPLVISRSCTIFQGFDGHGGEPMNYSAIIGNYYFISGTYDQPYPLCIYVVKGEEVFTLEEAYDMRAIDIEDVLPFLPVNWTNAYPLGDMDQDGKVELEDVLTMQKAVAQIVAITSLPSGNYGINPSELADLNHDGKVTVADVLLTQRILAGEQLPWTWHQEIGM